MSSVPQILLKDIIYVINMDCKIFFSAAVFDCVGSFNSHKLWTPFEYIELLSRRSDVHAFIEQILVFNLCISFTRNFNV